MLSWDRSVDFLVVGSGAAGMTAALRAHDLGGDTLVVEKSPRFGGSTALSGGVVWVPNNPLMARAGISDSAEEALRYLESVTAGSSTTDKLRAYVETAPRMMPTLRKAHAKSVQRRVVRNQVVPSSPVARAANAKANGTAKPTSPV